MALFKHKITGQIINAPEHYGSNPVLGRNLIPVEAEFPHAEKKQKKQAHAALPEVEAQQGETLIIKNEEK
jgi:ribosomal protein S24E